METQVSRGGLIGFCQLLVRPNLWHELWAHSGDGLQTTVQDHQGEESTSYSRNFLLLAGHRVPDSEHWKVWEAPSEEDLQRGGSCSGAGKVDLSRSLFKNVSPFPSKLRVRSASMCQLNPARQCLWLPQCPCHKNRWKPKANIEFKTYCFSATRNQGRSAKLLLPQSPRWSQSRQVKYRTCQLSFLHSEL